MEEGQHELRRSHKIPDFPGGPSGITRERSFIRPQHHQHHQGQNLKRRSQIFQQQQQAKGKPTLEIYRPPNVRSDGQLIDPINPKLNVHAKEFTMRQQHLAELQTSRSSVHIPKDTTGALLNLQHSRSSGNILRHHPLASIQHLHQQVQLQTHHMLPIPLLQSASSGNLMHPSPRVHFQMQAPPNFSNPNFRPQPKHIPPSSLKRSKSMSAADPASLAAKIKSMSIVSEASDLGEFPADVQSNIKLAMDDPNKLQARALMDLAKIIMERVVEGRRYSVPGAKICAAIIERERTETFLESLLNTCQQWYQERDRILRNVTTGGDGSRFTTFMWFLTEMACQLKRRRLQRDAAEREPPGLVMLGLLVRCCQACVKPPIRSKAEIECLFFVLTSIGKDLEQELPIQLDQLLTSVRDAFLASAALPEVRKILLQLIELKASNWQLSGPTVLYYYPKMK